MTSSQIFQLFGLAFFVIGIGMLLNPKNIKDLMNDLEHSTAALYLSGLLALTIGYLLVTYYNSWSLNRFLIITFIAWAGLIKGVSILIFPNFSLDISGKIVKDDLYLRFFSWFSIFFGILCLYFGYFV